MGVTLAIGALGAGLLGGVPANAATGSPSSSSVRTDPPPGGDQGARGPAPFCVKGWVKRGIVTQTGYAENKCGYTLRLKIIWAFGADGACATVEDRHTLTSKVAVEPRRFDGVGTC